MIERRTVPLPGPGPDVTVLRGGEGPTLVYLHGLQGASEADPLVGALAEHFEVVAPVCPGFLDVDDLEEVTDVHDLALLHDDLLGALDLDGVPVVGHSLGGMIAAELDAHVPPRVSRLVLVAPFGIWRDDQQPTDIFTAYPLGLADLLWTDPASAEARAAMGALAQTEEAGVDDPVLAGLLALARGMTTAGKFLWPLPDRGVERRLHRVTAPTLLVWGADDAIVPRGHAELFAAAIPDTAVEVLPGAGHMVPYERIGWFVDTLRAFVAG